MRYPSAIVHICRAGLACAALLASMSVGLEAQKAGRAQRPAARPAGPRFHQYQVAAGTTLPIELRTRITSNASTVAEEIEGRLLRALTSADGVELVPAGATVLGTVREAEPAGIKRPGRVSLTFHVIQHPDTGSRATIKSSVLRYQSEPPLKGKVFPDVRLEKGTDTSVLLLAPLVVQIPAAN